MKKTILFQKSISKFSFSENFFKIFIYLNFKNEKNQNEKIFRAYYYAEQEFFKKYNSFFCSNTMSSFLSCILEYRFLLEKLYDKSNKVFNENCLEMNENNHIFYNLSIMISSDQVEINFPISFFGFILCEKLNIFFLDLLTQNLILMVCVDSNKYVKKNPLKDYFKNMFFTKNIFLPKKIIEKKNFFLLKDKNLIVQCKYFSFQIIFINSFFKIYSFLWTIIDFDYVLPEKIFKHGDTFHPNTFLSFKKKFFQVEKDLNFMLSFIFKLFKKNIYFTFWRLLFILINKIILNNGIESIKYNTMLDKVILYKHKNQKCFKKFIILICLNFTSNKEISKSEKKIKKSFLSINILKHNIRFYRFFFFNFFTQNSLISPEILNEKEVTLRKSTSRILLKFKMFRKYIIADQIYVFFIFSQIHGGETRILLLIDFCNIKRFRSLFCKKIFKFYENKIFSFSI